MQIRVWFYTPNASGMTENERWDAFGKPENKQYCDDHVPEAYRYLWDLYFTLSGQLQRVRDGVCSPVPPSELLAWSTLTGTSFDPLEYAIVSRIDAAYCQEVNALIDKNRKSAQNNQQG